MSELPQLTTDYSNAADEFVQRLHELDSDAVNRGRIHPGTITVHYSTNDGNWKWHWTERPTE